MLYGMPVLTRTCIERHALHPSRINPTKNLYPSKHPTPHLLLPEEKFLFQPVTDYDYR
ncbi:hypothetical protein EMIT0232MI5_110207 [Pseudomonas sp. IT-232MI5]